MPSGGLPIDVGVVVFNVGTAFAAYEAVMKNRPLIDRVVTVTGKSLEKPSNFQVRIGTPVSYLVEKAGGLPERYCQGDQRGSHDGKSHLHSGCTHGKGKLRNSADAMRERPGAKRSNPASVAPNVWEYVPWDWSPTC